MAENVRLARSALVLLEKHCTESPSTPNEVTKFLINEKSKIIKELDYIEKNFKNTQNLSKNDTSNFRFAIIGDRDAIKIDFLNAILAGTSDEQAFKPSPTMKLLCTVKVKGTQGTSVPAETDKGIKIPLETDLTALIKTTGNKEKKQEFGVNQDSEILLHWPQQNSPVLQEHVEILVIPAVNPGIQEADVVIVVGDLAKGIGTEKKDLAKEKARVNIIIVYDTDLSAEDPKNVVKTRQDVQEFARDVFFIDLKKYKESKKIQECGELQMLLDCLKNNSSAESKLTGAQEELKKSTNDLKHLVKKILENMFLIRDFLVQKQQQSKMEKSECLVDESNIPVICNDILGLLDSILLGELEIESTDEPCQCCYQCCCCERKKWRLSVHEKMAELEKNRKSDRGVFEWFWQVISPCAEISIEKEEDIMVMNWYCDKITTQLKEKFEEYIKKPSTTSNSLCKHLQNLSATDSNFLKIEPSDFNNLNGFNYSPLQDIHFYGRNAKFTIPAGVLVFFPAYVVIELLFASAILAVFGGVIGLGASFLVRKKRRVSCNRVQKMNAYLRKVTRSRLEKKLLDVLRYNEGRSDGINQQLNHAVTDLSELDELINPLENFITS